MPLVVETGSGDNSSAISYCDSETLNTWLDARGYTVASSDAVLVKAMDVFNTLSWAGTRSSDSQPLPFPRAGLTVDGVVIWSDEIPQALINAQMELAYQISEGNNPFDVQSNLIKREKVDVLEVEYQDGGAQFSIKMMPSVYSLIKPLLNEARYISRA